MKMNIHIIKLRIIALVMLLPAAGCNKFFDVEIDRALVPIDKAFGDNSSAISTMAGVYRTIVDGALLGGGDMGITNLTGMTSDELSNILGIEEYRLFEENNIPVDSRMVSGQWNNGYAIIYQVNDIIEELKTADGVDMTVKQQLTGESLFIRAFTYFYLINLYGDVPLVLNTDYRKNSQVSRTAVETVYGQIVSDLEEAYRLLNEAYNAPDRVRPNKLAVAALLARVHLYRGNWQQAVDYADELISHPYYEINQELGEVFKKQSVETIWELASNKDHNTIEGETFIIEYDASSHHVQLTASLLASFENNDDRKSTWIGTFINADSSAIYNFPYKYKSRYYTPPAENYIVLRLTEQFLIRAEANTRLNNFDAAADDLDAIRFRAGLPSVRTIVPVLTEETLMAAIIRERRSEFFAEWGHRWFDLKRWNLADATLGFKPDWSADDVLFPLPLNELRANPKLGEQNPGY